MCLGFLPRDAIVQIAVLRLNVVRPSVRPSVRLYVTLVDQEHISWKSWKLIVQTIGPTSSFFVAQSPSTIPHNPRVTWGNFGETRGGVGKVAFWGAKAAISVKRVKIEEKLLWRAYRNSPTLFRTVTSRPPTPSSSPRLGVRNPTQNFNRYQERVKLYELQILYAHS